VPNQGALREPGHSRIVLTMQVPALSTDKQPQAPARTERKLRVTAKVRTAIEQMVWSGLKRDQAAQKAGLTDHSLYVALRSPHVKAHYLAECEVLRVSGRARRIHRLEQMVEQDDNKAAVVNAALALERLGDSEDSQRAAKSLPGLQIVIVQGGAAQPPMIDVLPTDLARD
jgi:hypothetical protein